MPNIHNSEPLSIINRLLLLVTGVYLALRHWSLQNGWIAVSLGSLVVVMTLLIRGVVDPRMRVIITMVKEAQDGPLPESLYGRIHDPVLGAGVQTLAAFVLGIVFLMTTKPALVGSIAVIVFALVFLSGTNTSGTYPPAFRIGRTGALYIQLPLGDVAAPVERRRARRAWVPEFANPASCVNCAGAFTQFGVRERILLAFRWRKRSHWNNVAAAARFLDHYGLDAAYPGDQCGSQRRVRIDGLAASHPARIAGARPWPGYGRLGPSVRRAAGTARRA